jgi:hypothetical protein
MEMLMFAVALAVSLAAPQPCPVSDPRAAILVLHEKAREAHLRGDAALIAAGMGDRLLFAEDGGIRIQTNAQVAEFFTGYFKRVRYRQWRDVSPPRVEVSPDGEMGWMAVAVEAHYTRADKPDEGEKTFKSSWIATYKRDQCSWRMTGIASDVVQ